MNQRTAADGDQWVSHGVLRGYRVLYRQSTSGHSVRISSSLIFGIVLIGANLRAPITSLGPVLPDVQRALNLNGTTAGLLNALPLLIFAVLSLVAPSAGRRFSLEHILGLSLIAILVGTLVRSLTFSGAIWIGTVFLSVGIAFGNVLLPGLVKRDFPDRAASLIGSYAAAMAGMAGVSTGIARPIASLTGSDWRYSIGIWAILAAASVLAWIPHWFGRQHYVRPASTSGTYISPWRHVVGWQVSLFFALHSLVFYSIVDWFASYIANSGVSLATAGWYLLIYQIVAIATNLGSVSLIRRLPDQRMLGFACGGLLTVGTAGLTLRPDLSLLWMIVAGLGAGVAMVTSLSLFALRTHDHHQAGALSGMAQFIGYLGAAAGPLLVGALHDFAGNWTPSLWLLVGSSLLVTVFATLAGRRRLIGQAVECAARSA